MTREQILATLRNHAPDLQSLGAARLYLFGSAARDETGSDSDVDLFFDYDAPDFSLVELVVLQDRISYLLATRADVMSRGSIRPRLRRSIEDSALRVF